MVETYELKNSRLFIDGVEIKYDDEMRGAKIDFGTREVDVNPVEQFQRDGVVVRVIDGRWMATCDLHGGEYPLHSPLTWKGKPLLTEEGDAFLRARNALFRFLKSRSAIGGQQEPMAEVQVQATTGYMTFICPTIQGCCDTAMAAPEVCHALRKPGLPEDQKLPANEKAIRAAECYMVANRIGMKFDTTDRVEWWKGSPTPPIYGGDIDELRRYVTPRGHPLATLFTEGEISWMRAHNVTIQAGEGPLRNGFKISVRGTGGPAAFAVKLRTAIELAIESCQTAFTSIGVSPTEAEYLETMKTIRKAMLNHGVPVYGSPILEGVIAASALRIQEQTEKLRDVLGKDGILWPQSAFFADRPSLPGILQPQLGAPDVGMKQFEVDVKKARENPQPLVMGDHGWIQVSGSISLDDEKKSGQGFPLMNQPVETLGDKELRRQAIHNRMFEGDKRNRECVVREASERAYGAPGPSHGDIMGDLDSLVSSPDGRWFHEETRDTGEVFILSFEPEALEPLELGLYVAVDGGSAWALMTGGDCDGSESFEVDLSNEGGIKGEGPVGALQTLVKHPVVRALVYAFGGTIND